MHRLAPRWLALVLLLGGGLILAFAPAAAQQTPGTATVSVEASVVIPTELSITLCDTAADFGDNLSYRGDPPSGTLDAIAATAPGDPAQNQGVFYVWTPTCASGSFMHVESNVSWRATICASESAGSSTTLRVANADLRYSLLKHTTYENAQMSAQIRTCDNPSTLRNLEPAGVHNFTYHLYLQVDRSDTPGTFNSVTTWTVTP